MHNGPIDCSRWNTALTSLLSDKLPADILAETCDYLATLIVNEEIAIPETHIELSLDELDALPLTSILQADLEPLLDCDSWGLLTSDLLDLIRQVPVEVNQVEKADDCELCHRQMPVTHHHLVPRSTHEYFLAHPEQLTFEVTKMSLRTRTIRLCRPCHTHVHATIRDHKTLAREYASIDKLVALESIKKFVAYIRKQRVSDGRMSTIKYRR